ncbi:MAG: AAA family ATPase [Ignavibacteriales bacterium]|nr:AAA family ATPase [Ignavibacteriales bacterium]
MNKKRIPSLSSNFADLISENAYYVDKTPFIHNLENLNFKYLFFLRPRSSGNPLLSMFNTTGIQYKDQFEALFGEYFIGKPENRTKLQNFYQILRFDFSGISTQNSVQIRDSFNLRLNSGFREFYSNYGLLDEKYCNSEINLSLIFKPSQ